MPYSTVTYAVDERIATVTLNRPDARNAFTVTMADELGEAIGAADADDDVRVLVITATGRDFCVGADLSGGGFAASEPGWIEPATRVARPIYESSKPVIAAVRGAAVGVGSTMLLPADYRLASTDSRFGFVFSRRGIYPEAGSTWFLPRIVGMGTALDWMISGRLIPAGEALAAGLVHSLHDPADVLTAAYDLARELIATVAPISVAVIRQAMYRMSALDSPYPAFDLDAKLIGAVAGDPEAEEGVRSFLERRPPRFTGVVSTGLPDYLPWRQGR